ncbi:hypothetical protein CY34DRAFT_14780 [Suillus luteus UH-Slu-Lm8-n1]|uniref:Uncharacterized protein n=1 Tax=Suillus luteus UH-Slu-Lm8-n1 TaxID=930992 RepID=A0A0D0B4S1_9AGAM|nr:hypothetical protein CY34DRAFT_14780 [Suillus luteus UH-Slu-Lm8-n1]
MAVRDSERGLNSARCAVDCRRVPDFGPDFAPDWPNPRYSGQNDLSHKKVVIGYDTEEDDKDGEKGDDIGDCGLAFGNMFQALYHDGFS